MNIIQAIRGRGLGQSSATHTSARRIWFSGGLIFLSHTFEKRLAIAPEAVQAIVDETEAKQVQAQDLIDGRYLAALESSGFFKQLWGK